MHTDTKLLNSAETLAIHFDNQAYVLSEKDFGTIQIDLQSVRGFNQIGGTVTGRSIGERPISLTGYVLADNKEDMVKRRRLLQQVCDVNGYFYVLLDDKYRLRVFPDSSIEYAVEYYKNNEYLCQFLITGLAFEPYFSDDYVKVEAGESVYDNLIYPIDIPEGKDVMGEINEGEFIFYNEGDIYSECYILLVADGGIIKNPTIKGESSLDGKLWGQHTEIGFMNTTITDGCHIDISSEDNIRQISTNVPQLYPYDGLVINSNGNNGFCQINPAYNRFTVTADSGAEHAKLYVWYKPSFLEV